MDTTEYTEQGPAPVVIIACTAAKAATAAPAAEMYLGQTFGLALAAALAEVDHDADRVFIMSARYGLLRLTTVVEPYNVTIGDAGAVTAGVLRAQAEALGLADHWNLFSMVPNAYYALLREALEPIGTYPQNSFEDARGVGDHRHVMTNSIRFDGVA